MILSKEGKGMLKKYRNKKDYIMQNKWFVFIVILQAFLWVFLITGNLSLGGIKLFGSIKSTASHQHGQYDNSFVTGIDKDGVIQGSGLEAVNIRATRGAVTGWYFLNEGQLTQHGAIVFAEEVNYKKGDNPELEGKFPLDIPCFSASGQLGLYPDYENNWVIISGLKFTAVQLQQMANDLKPYSEGTVTCGKD